MSIGRASYKVLPIDLSSFGFLLDVKTPRGSGRVYLEGRDEYFSSSRAASSRIPYIEVSRLSETWYPGLDYIESRL